MKYIAIDLGLRRIGVACCVSKDLVIPLDAIQRKNRNQAAGEVDDILKKYGADILVVGIPMGGSAQEEMQRRVNHFVSLLSFKGDVVLQDESGTSVEAKEMLKGKIKQKRDGRIDSISAQIILQRFLQTVL